MGRSRIKETLKSITKVSLLENNLSKQTRIKDKQLEKHKSNSLKTSVFVGLFLWLFVGAIIKNIVLSAGVAIGAIAIIFLILTQLPLLKKKAYSKKVEADLPLFLTTLATELHLGKNFARAIADSCKEEGFSAKEFSIVAQDMKKGASFQEALQNMNLRLSSPNIRRVCSNLSNLSISQIFR